MLAIDDSIFTIEIVNHYISSLDELDMRLLMF